MKKGSVAAALFGLVFVSTVGVAPVGVEAHIRTTANRAVALVHGVYHIAYADGSRSFDLEYSGSAFLIRDDWLGSCRHVLAPWEDDPSSLAAVTAGGRPVFTTLTATFPEAGTVQIAVESIRYDAEVDVAVARLSQSVNVTPLEVREDGSEGDGDQAFVLGYPLGVRLLSYRLEGADVAGFPRSGTKEEQIQFLLSKGAVWPLFFRGVINSDQDHLITTDAAMIFGCSGGPVLGDDGRVIGVAFAIVNGFDGMNMVAPIGHLLELIKD